jgi:hypothetical protein
MTLKFKKTWIGTFSCFGKKIHFFKEISKGTHRALYFVLEGIQDGA